MNQKKVVLFEDNESDIEQFKEAAQKKGIKVLAIRTPGQGKELREHLKKIEKIEPELIVVDLGFYGSNLRGYKILEGIASNSNLREIPIIVWSMYINETSQGNAVKKKLVKGIGPKFKNINYISKFEDVDKVLSVAE